MFKKPAPLVALLFFWVVSGVSARGLKWVKVNVPRYRTLGETVQMECDYDLGDDKLYSVKWYKEHEEFYRFVPKSRPQMSKYDVDGVSVDLDHSDSNTVVLRNVNHASSGLYTCEVSAEAPSFASAQSEARMDVVLLPKEDPVITGQEDQYHIGDTINLNCTSGKSHPAPILDWYINEQQVKNDDALIPFETVRHEQGLESSVLGLQFILDERHFVGGSMRVKCVASVSPLLWRADKESVVQSSPVESLGEALLLVRSGASSSAICAWTFLVMCAKLFVN